MKKILTTFCLLSLLGISACDNKSNAKHESNLNNNSQNKFAVPIHIPFVEAKNYFVLNTYDEKDFINAKIESQKELDKFFGMATTMGENGKPTAIDFSTQYVIALIGDETNISTNYSVDSLTKVENTIRVHYNIKEGEKQNFTMQPCLLVIVDKKYEGNILMETIL